MPTPLEIKLVVFDWAGTTIDFGCMAPSGAFVAAFAARGVAVSLAEARGPMGLHKKDHVRAMLCTESVGTKWRATTGRDWTEDDVNDLYRAVIPLQVEAAARYCNLIPEIIDAVTELRRRGIKIAATTGYFRAAADAVLASAQRQGYEPDFTICADDVPAGRPAPWMCWENARRLNVFPAAAMVKIDDTPVGIEAGLNAGMWTVGVAMTGNETGLSQTEAAALPAADRVRRMQRAYERLTASGAHYVVDGVADLLPVLDTIELRLADGGRP